MAHFARSNVKVNKMAANYEKDMEALNEDGDIEMTNNLGESRAQNENMKARTIGKVCKSPGCGAICPIRKQSCGTCGAAFEKAQKRKLKLNKKPNETIQKGIIQDRINELHRLCNLNFVVLLTKKHGNGTTVESMCTQGFGENFVGTDPRNRPESGRLVMDMLKTFFKDYCRTHPEEGLEQEPSFIVTDGTNTQDQGQLSSKEQTKHNDMDIREPGQSSSVIPPEKPLEDQFMTNNGEGQSSSVVTVKDKLVTKKGKERKQRKLKSGSVVAVCTINEHERFWLFRVKNQVRGGYSGDWFNLDCKGEYTIGSPDTIRKESIISVDDVPFSVKSTLDASNKLMLSEEEEANILCILETCYA